MWDTARYRPGDAPGMTTARKLRPNSAAEVRDFVDLCLKQDVPIGKVRGFLRHLGLSPAMIEETLGSMPNLKLLKDADFEDTEDISLSLDIQVEELRRLDAQVLRLPVARDAPIVLDQSPFKPKRKPEEELSPAAAVAVAKMSTVPAPRRASSRLPDFRRLFRSLMGLAVLATLGVAINFAAVTYVDVPDNLVLSVTRILERARLALGGEKSPRHAAIRIGALTERPARPARAPGAQAR